MEKIQENKKNAQIEEIKEAHMPNVETNLEMDYFLKKYLKRNN